MKAYRPQRATYLVCYDVATADRAGLRRLRRVARMCESYGVRIQKSVFECDLTPYRLQKMRGRASELIDPRTDSFLVIAVDAARPDAKWSVSPLEQPLQRSLIV